MQKESAGQSVKMQHRNEEVRIAPIPPADLFIEKINKN